MTKYKLSTKGKEHDFQKSFIEGFVISDNVKYIDHEVKLFPALKILTQDIRRDVIDPDTDMIVEGDIMGFGRIDLVVRHKCKTYCVEIKYRHNNSSDFWESLKIVGYTEYYKWQMNNNSFLPAIIIPKENLRLEHQIVAGRCGITIFTVEEKDNKYYLKVIDDRPYWKQGEKKSVDDEVLTKLE
jgi:Holliday junction resolvase-like predicted endonuclease